MAVAAAINLANPEQVTVWPLDDGYAGLRRENVRDSISSFASTDHSSKAIVEAKPASKTTLTNGPKFDPPFKSSWSFAHAETKYMTYVFGVRDDKKVCMISPTYLPLPNAEASTFSVAASGSTNDLSGRDKAKDTVRVFYVALADANATKGHLVEYTLATQRVNPLRNVVVDKDSRLCAYHDKNVDYCFFLNDKLIHVYDTHSTSSSLLRNAGSPLAATPLAICTLNSVTCLFFLDHGNGLMVVECKNKIWGQSKGAGDPSAHLPPKAAANVDMAAIASKVHSTIIVYYKHQGSSQTYDSWAWENPNFT